MLLDITTAMKSENMTYHLWVISEYPEIAGEFIQCGANAGYNGVHLTAALVLDPNQ